MKYCYIPQQLIKYPPPGDYPVTTRTLYIPRTNTLAICFESKSQDDIEAILKFLGLVEPEWKNVSNYVVLTKAKTKPLLRQSPKKLLELYSELRKNASTTRKKTLKADRDRTYEEASTLLEQLTASYEYIYNIEHAKELAKDSHHVAEEELKSLHNLQGVDHVILHGDYLIVRTKPLNTRKYRIGCYTITVNVKTARFVGAVSDTPIKEEGYFYHHRNIYGIHGSNVCWGNIAGVIAEFQAKHDIIGLVGTVIEFLELDDRDSWLLAELDKKNRKKEAKKR